VGQYHATGPPTARFGRLWRTTSVRRTICGTARLHTHAPNEVVLPRPDGTESWRPATSLRALLSRSRQRVELALIILTAVSVISVPAGHARAEANECFYVGPTDISDVIGNTWMGRLQSARPLGGADQHAWKLTFKVTDILAGVESVQVGDRMRLFNGPCHDQPLDMGLHVNHRYLISSADAPRDGRLNTDSIVIWEVSDRGLTYQNAFYESASTLESTFRSKRTLDEALALVTPSNATPTDSVGPSEFHSVDYALVVRLLATLGEMLWAFVVNSLSAPGSSQ
jgi:hypothetical protein